MFLVWFPLLLVVRSISSTATSPNSSTSSSISSHHRGSHSLITSFETASSIPPQEHSTATMENTVEDPHDTMPMERVCIIGSGNWGSAIATIVGRNCQLLPFCHNQVKMWVYEELVPVPVPVGCTGTSHISNSISSSRTSDTTNTSVNTEMMNLTHVINTFHENVKYLPNIKLPPNVLAVSNITEACHDATLIIFALPHQFLTQKLLQQIASSFVQYDKTRNSSRRPFLRGISLIKGGLEVDKVVASKSKSTGDSSSCINYNNEDYYYQPRLLSQRISNVFTQYLREPFPCGVLMGANVANDVALQQFAECTLACDFQLPPEYDPSTMSKKVGTDIDWNERTRRIFHSDLYFRVQHTLDVTTTEICGALKNIIALGAGFVDGLQYGSNTKAALIRIGLLEMKRFCSFYFPPSSLSLELRRPKQGEQEPIDTFWQSCGIADLITTCFSGRNRKCACEFAKIRSSKSRPNDNHTYEIHELKNLCSENAIPGDASDTNESCEALWKQLETDFLQGQKLQGTLTCKEVIMILKSTNRLDSFPLIHTIYKIAFLGAPVESILDGIITAGTSTSSNFHGKSTDTKPIKGNASLDSVRRINVIKSRI